MRTTSKTLIILVLGVTVALLAACGGMDHASAGGSVEVSDAWARTSAMDQQMGAAYMTIHGGADGDTLTGVSVPTDIAARVGQTIRIANRDDRTYLLGPFIVGPHETLTQRFASPGTFTGECAVHPGGTIRLVVSA